MNHLTPAVARFATGLAVLVGFGDTLALLTIVPYLRQAGLGDFTAGTAMLSLLTSVAGPALALIVAFLAGVVGSSLAGYRAKGRRRQAVLALATLLFAVAALLNAASAGPALLVTAMALGALHGVLEGVPAVTIGVLEAIGRLGEMLATIVSGRTSHDWATDLLLVVGLLIGITAGLIVYPLFGLNGIWLAALLAGLLSIITAISNRMSPK